MGTINLARELKMSLLLNWHHLPYSLGITECRDMSTPLAIWYTDLEANR